MVVLRVLFSSMVGGALLGILLASLLGPRHIESQWDDAAGGEKSNCFCAATARNGADRIVALQMKACAVGATLGCAAGVVFLVVRRKRAAAKGATAAAPPGATP